MKIGVFKFSSCDGCQLLIIDILEDLVKLRDVEVLYFLEVQSNNEFREFDISFVEGSISTNEEVERIKEIREKSNFVVSIGACAVSGGVQSNRNFLNFNDVKSYVYKDKYIENILEKAFPISHFVNVDYEIRGCPISKDSVENLISSIIIGKPVQTINYPVCLECKRNGNICLLILGKSCLGPITVGGCNALCPSFNRGCYGCYGPFKEAPIETLKKLFEEKNWNLEEFIKDSFNSVNDVFMEKLWK